MANILIFNHSEIIKKNQRHNICYTEGLIKSFLIRGHNVKNIITNDYLYDPWCGLNILKNNINYKYILKKIKDFNPDLIISFNNSKLPNIEKELECPIIIWEADKYYFFSDKYNLKKTSSRYFFFSSTLNGKKQFTEYFNAKKEKIFFMPHSTSIQSKIIKQDKNISFIGKLYELPKYNENKKNLVQRNAIYRKNILSSIQDLGLKIFTNEVPMSYKDLQYLCSPKMDYYSISHNEKIFNSSKISLNVSHLQAKDNTVSYRAIDIMASNSLLLTEQSNYLQFFSKKLSDIFYNTPFDLRKKIKFFLANPNARKELTNIQNDIVKKNFLWADRVKEIEQIFGLKKNIFNKNANVYSKVVRKTHELYKSTNTKKYKKYNIIILSLYIFLKVNKYFSKIYLKKFVASTIENQRISINKSNIFLYLFYLFIFYIKNRVDDTKKIFKNI